MQIMHNSATNTVYTISISSLATALTVSVVVSITVIVIILKRSNTKINALEQQLINRSINMEPMCEDVTGPLPSVSAINTQDNVAYGQPHNYIS